MTKTIKLLASASALAAAAMATPAFAADLGTDSGTVITNNVSVKFSVGGVEQSPTSATANFTVDRKIALTVSELGTATTNVTPGATQQATTFTVRNTTNGALSVKLSAAQDNAVSGDSFDVSNFAYYLDDGDNVFDAGDTVITDALLVSVPEDGSRVVHVLATIPVVDGANAQLTNGDIAGIRLTGTAWNNTNAGGALVNATGANQEDAVDNVFADAAANGDLANNGLAYDDDSYTVVTAEISAAKYNRAISDPINNTTNPKMIPGAVVEYCIAITNNTAVSATGVQIADVIPANTTFVPNSIFTNQSVDANGVCTGATAVTDASGYLTSLPAGPRVAATISESIDEDETWGVRFQVRVN